MLSDSPPDRDVIWTEDGVQGAYRFVQRLWRLANELAEITASPSSPRPNTFSELGEAVRKSAHTALARVSEDIERLRFNRCVAHIYEAANSLTDLVADARTSKSVSADVSYAFREASDILIRLTAPMMPHLAEECWVALGNKTLVADQPWPTLERELLIEQTITLPVQVNGKKRADVTVPRDAGTKEVRKAPS